MKNQRDLIVLLVGSLVLVAATVAQSAAQSNSTPKPQTPAAPPTVTSIIDRQLSTLERDFVPAAEAMPEDKYSFAPTSGEFKGVRTFAQQVKHVAATNFAISAALLQEKPRVDPSLDNGPDDIKTREDILKFLKDSFALAHKAVATVNDKNVTEMIPGPWNPKNKSARLALSTMMTWHSFDHYGQMVEYLRMNGIIPPASRPK